MTAKLVHDGETVFVLIGGHKFERVGAGRVDRHCYAHQSGDCFDNLTPHEHYSIRESRT